MEHRKKPVTAFMEIVSVKKMLSGTCVMSVIQATMAIPLETFLVDLVHAKMGVQPVSWTLMVSKRVQIVMLGMPEGSVKPVPMTTTEIMRQAKKKLIN